MHASGPWWHGEHSHYSIWNYGKSLTYDLLEVDSPTLHGFGMGLESPVIRLSTLCCGSTSALFSSELGGWLRSLHTSVVVYTSPR